MSAENLIRTLEKLLLLHQNLYKVALQKTTCLKSERIDELRELLKQEQKFVQASKQLEEERIRLTKLFLGREENLTLSACIEKATGEEKEKLQFFLNNFTETMDMLKGANRLNKELTLQSLQFVSLTLDMLMPQKNITNYNRPESTSKPVEKVRRSLFDSKA